MPPMFDPDYVLEVMNDILSRRGLRLVAIPKDQAEVSQGTANLAPKEEAESAAAS